MTPMLCSSVYLDVLNNTHICDKEETHTTEHGCHCGVTWEGDDTV